MPGRRILKTRSRSSSSNTNTNKSVLNEQHNQNLSLTSLNLQQQWNYDVTTICSSRRLNVILSAMLLFVMTERFMFQLSSLSPASSPSLSTMKNQQEEKDTTTTATSYTFTLSTEENDGFHPIYIYSNPITAESEVPRRDSVKTNPFGSGYYSQVWQDKIVLAITTAIDDKKRHITNQQTSPSISSISRSSTKFFVDLASNNALELSNTLHLEQNGWNGICIEGDPRYWYGLGRYRKCIVIGGFVGGQEDGVQVDIALTGVSTGIVGDKYDQKVEPSKKKDRVVEKRDLVSLKTIFRKTNAPPIIDYLSLDVEGAESLIMTDFPWDDYQIQILTVERPKPDLIQMLEDHGYQFVQTLVRWGETLWVHSDLLESNNGYFSSRQEIMNLVGQVAPGTIEHQNKAYVPVGGG